jgi:acetyl/propionyl-CoA carboxylase alpha subunit
VTAPRKLLVANRGEIAVRIMRTASEMGLETVGIAPDDDFASLHIREANEAVLLPGAGAQAYLAIDNIINVARTTGCGMIHPGYGFLSESAAFAAACVEAGLAFVGPTPDTLALFGDKVRARNAAKTSGLPLLPGSSDQTTLAEAQAFFASLEPGEAMMIKALAGGGGRRSRIRIQSLRR